MKFLPNLNTLVLSRNKIDSFSTTNTGQLRYLVKLSLSHNSLSVFPDINDLTALEELKMSNNTIREIPATFLSGQRKLKTLDVSHNLLSDWNEVRKLVHLKSLTNLALRGNPFPELTDDIDDIEVLLVDYLLIICQIIVNP